MDSDFGSIPRIVPVLSTEQNAFDSRQLARHTCNGLGGDIQRGMQPFLTKLCCIRHVRCEGKEKKMKRTLCVLAVSIAVAGCATPLDLNYESEVKPEIALVIYGTVIDTIESARDDSGVEWLVTVRVLQVLTGAFEHETLSLRLRRTGNSGKSGLKVSERYWIEAIRDDHGYRLYSHET